MKGMFFNVATFNGNLTRWDVSFVTDMGHMFDGATVSMVTCPVGMLAQSLF